MRPSSDPLEDLLLEALPPLHRRVRRAVVTKLARRLRESCPRPHGGGDGHAPWLREALQALVAEVAGVEAEAAALTRRYNEAPDEAARRQVLVDHLTETVKDRKERREDLRALDRWMGLDALRERLERKRHRLLVEEETALRCLAGVLRRLDEETRVTHAPVLASLAGELLGRAVDAPRAQNRLAALECFHELVRREPAAAAGLLEAGVVLSGLVGQEDASPFFQAEALRALLVTDVLAGLALLRQRLRGPYPSAKDFLFRRQALELAAPLLPAEHLLPLLAEVASHDPSEFVRMGLCGMLATRPEGQPLLRQLAGLDGATQSPRVRAAAVLAAVEAARQESRVRDTARALLADVLHGDTHALVLRVACEQAAALAEALGGAGLGEAHPRLTEAVSALRMRPDTEGPVLETAANAEQVLRRTADPARLAWTRYLAARVEKLRPGGRTKVTLAPLPDGLPPMPEEPAWLGAILADLSRDGYGLYAERTERTLTLWQGDRKKRRLWRILHELRTPAPNKRQAFQHTTGRVMPGTLRAHPGHLDEITETVVPGERVHVASQGGWGRHLPTVDDLLDLPLRASGKVHLFSSHGTTVLVPPPSLARRLRNRLKVTREYQRLSALRLHSLQGEEPRERRRFVEHVEKDLGVLVHFAPHEAQAPVPDTLSTLFGDPGAREGSRLHSSALVGLESGFLAVLTERILESEGYFLGTGGNGVAALGLFTAALFTVFLGETYVKRQRVREARAQVPLCIGGWGTRGKSGTERLKAALFTGLGFDVFAKTTGSEAMFVHSAPGGAPTEFFIFRPYDKATIWEQKDMVELGARLGTEVFLWECMALQPNFVELLQNDWMKDDLATLTNAYPDHEDIQGPAGMDVASVITKFMPKGGRVVTTEDHFLPLFQRAAKDGGTALHHSAWWEAELIPEELLALFPYREHPRNMALVATLGEQLGVPRSYALAMMAEHVQPEIGVLKVFPSVKVRGRKLTFINGHSANERTGFLNNWRRTGLDTVEPETQPDRAVITVINNRWDRVARSEVFARIMVEDAVADRHVLIGTNLEGLQKYVRDALDRYLQRTEVVAREDLVPGADAGRPEARLTRELARLKIPRPTPEAFLERLELYARGAGLAATRTPDLVAAVESALGSADDELHVARIRQALEREVGPVLDAALGEAPVREDPAAPEVLAPATLDEVREHALYTLARLVVHARLRRALPGEGADDGAVAAFHRRFREAYRELYLEQLVPVSDAGATGDQVIDACARAVPPGLSVSIMGAQNIKGTGLDWVYRWLALDRVGSALEALQKGATEARRRALESLETFADSGLVDSGLARAVLPRLAMSAHTPEEAERLRRLAERARATHEARLAALRHTGTATFMQSFTRKVEKVFDYLDSVQRRRLSDLLLEDLVHGRVSHARAALETRRLYERQKGGWLLAGFGKRGPEEPVPAVEPRPVAREPVAPPPLREVFEEALEAKRDDVAVPVPRPVPGVSNPVVGAPRTSLEGTHAKSKEEREPAAQDATATRAPVDDAGDPAS
jgi:poly-gamma-glutamate synthase PgsB/CapB